jgi:hypothetical protein
MIAKENNNLKVSPEGEGFNPIYWDNKSAYLGTYPPFCLQNALFWSIIG